MKIVSQILTLLISFFYLCYSHANEEDSAMFKEVPIEPMLRGSGCVYFLAEPGELEIIVEKRSANNSDTNRDTSVLFFGPDREVLEEQFFTDDDQDDGSELRGADRMRFSIRVESRGVYGISLTTYGDRFGNNLIWGFWTNCQKYLISFGRGHKDERHVEPIHLSDPGVAGDICFLPRDFEWSMNVSDLPEDVTELYLYDDKGALRSTLKVEDGKAEGRFPGASEFSRKPWRLHFPSMKGTVNIDGLTRWDSGDLYPNLCYWTPRAQSWFPFLDYRWLLTPYSRIVHQGSEKKGITSFVVHNNSNREVTVLLSVEFPDEAWPVSLKTESVVLDPKQSRSIEIAYEVASSEAVCRIRAESSDGDFSTYSTLEVREGEAPAYEPLEMPIRLKPYEHENKQLGYLPEYPTYSQPYFDLHNKPYIPLKKGVARLEDDVWTTASFADSVTATCPDLEGASLTTSIYKVAFDSDNDLYLIAHSDKGVALLHSSDEGKTFQAHLIPGHDRNTHGFDIEQFSGNNTPNGPPCFVRFKLLERDPTMKWRRIQSLELFAPVKVDGQVQVGDPILISSKSLGRSGHSGVPSTLVSKDGKVHLTWGEATDPEKDIPGVPTYVTTYDRETGQITERALVGYGPPANDAHNTPSITMDDQGYLHVLIGTHGRPFQHVTSLKPNDSGAGWTEPVFPGKGLKQTYIGFVCDSKGTLHVVYRLWRYGEPFPKGSHHATLAYQRKSPGKAWEPPKILVVAPLSEYSIFYHRLTIDRSERLFLSYNYWSTYWFYRKDHFGDRRTLIMSPDGGNNWEMVNGADF